MTCPICLKESAYSSDDFKTAGLALGQYRFPRLDRGLSTVSHRLQCIGSKGPLFGLLARPATCPRLADGGHAAVMVRAELPRRAGPALMPKGGSGRHLSLFEQVIGKRQGSARRFSRQATVRFLRERSSVFEDQSPRQRSGFVGPGANCGQMPNFNGTAGRVGKQSMDLFRQLRFDGASAWDAMITTCVGR